MTRLNVTVRMLDNGDAVVDFDKSKLFAAKVEDLMVEVSGAALRMAERERALRAARAAAEEDPKKK